MTFFDKLVEMLFTNWKTTAAGLVTGVGVLLNDLGLIVSPELQTKLTAWLVGIGMIIFGLVSKDSGKKEEPVI
jgi:hypothetical protein